MNLQIKMQIEQLCDFQKSTILNITKSNQLHQQVIVLLSEILLIDEILIEKLEQLPNKEQYRQLILLFQKNILERRTFIYKASNSYNYNQYSNKCKNFQYQLQQCLNKIYGIPRIIKIYQKLSKIVILFVKEKDFQKFQNTFQILMGELQKCKGQIFFQNISWKSISYKIVVEKMMKKRKSKSKLQLLSYIKLTNNLLKQQKITIHSISKAYRLLTLYCLFGENQSVPYLKLQLQKLIKFDILSDERNRILQLIKQCQSTIKQNLNKFLSKWNQNYLQSIEKSKCRVQLLKHNQALIQPRQPILRRKYSFHRTNLRKSGQIFSETKSKKRMGIISSKNTFVKKYKDLNDKTVSQYLFNRSHGNSIYSIIGEKSKKDEIITIETLMFEMDNIKPRQYQYPCINHQQIQITFKKLTSFSSVNTNHSANIHVDGQIIHHIHLNYIQFFGNQTYRVKISSYQNSLSFLLLLLPNLQNSLLFQNKHLWIKYQQLKKLISSSELYFQLIRQKLQTPISINDISLIQKLLSKQQVQLEQPQLIMILSTIRMVKWYLYWYYSEQIKLNGRLLVKRIKPRITDSLKFSIALEELRKNNAKNSSAQLRNVRNKTGLVECFYYLSYGRQILAKGVSFFNNQLSFTIYSLNRQFYKNCQINQQTKCIEFEKVFLQQKQYKLKNWQIQSSKLISLLKILKGQHLQLFLLENIIESKLSKKYLLRLLKLFYGSQQIDPIYYSYLNNIQKSNINIIETIRDKKQSISWVKKSQKVYINPKLQSYLSIFKYFSNVYELSYNFKIKRIISNLKKIEGKIFRKIQYILHSGFSLIQIKSLSNHQMYICLSTNSFPKEQDLIIIKRPYNNILGVQIEQNSQIYKINSIKRNLKQQFFRNKRIMIIKTIIKIVKYYYYISVAYDINFNSYRIDFYKSDEQRLFFTYVNPRQLPENKVEKQKLYKMLSKQSLINGQKNKYFKVQQPTFLDHKDPKFWKPYLKKIKIYLDSYKVFIFSKSYNLLQKYGNIENNIGQSQGQIQLIEYNNRRLFLLNCYKDIKLYIGEVDENPMSYNTNLFTDFSYKDYKVNYYNDLLVRLYMRYLNSDIKCWEIKVDELNDPLYFQN